jgi:hypothetical protein
MPLDRGFCLLDASNLRHGGAFPEVPAQFIELLAGADGIDFHPAVIEVARPALYADVVGDLFYKPPKPDTLDPTGYKVAPGRFRAIFPHAR